MHVFKHQSVIIELCIPAVYMIVYKLLLHLYDKVHASIIAWYWERIGINTSTIWTVLHGPRLQPHTYTKGNSCHSRAFMLLHTFRSPCVLLHNYIKYNLAVQRIIYTAEKLWQQTSADCTVCVKKCAIYHATPSSNTIILYIYLQYILV